MVTSVGTTAQSAYISATNNTQKTNSQSETGSVSTKNYIEDAYTPSFDFGTLSGGFAGRPSSLEGFKNVLKRQITKDYESQNPQYKILFASSESLTVNQIGNGSVFESIWGKKDTEATNALKEYLDNIDYEKEYEKYKQSRGCKNNEDLVALNRTPFQHKEDLVQFVSSQIRSVNYDKYGPIASKIAKSMSLNALADLFLKNVGQKDGKEIEKNLQEVLSENNKKIPTIEECYNASLIANYTN